jgi:3-hydroxyisobutyrate dehydrogenase-like beta-hydroxyacid dehydrogenase
MRVGFIGLGHMGAAMAGSLLRAGHEVTVSNRTPGKAQGLIAAAETLRVPMPLASLVHDRLQSLIARGGEHLDWSAIAQLAANDAGLR